MFHRTQIRPIVRCCNATTSLKIRLVLSPQRLNEKLIQGVLVRILLKGKQIIDGYADEYGNRIIGSAQVSPNSTIEFRSEGCKVEFSKGAKFNGSIFFLREDSQVIVGDGSLLRGRSSLGANSTIRLGKGVYSGSNLQITTAESCSVDIGEDVLIANDCRFRADDSHPIFDGITGKRINKSASITIGKHVWVGQEVFLMPGSLVGEGSVVGARAIVTKSRSIPANSLAVGSPAKVVRKNIVWVRKHLQLHTDIPDSIDPIFEEEALAVSSRSKNAPRWLANLKMFFSS